MLSNTASLQIDGRVVVNSERSDTALLVNVCCRSLGSRSGFCSVCCWCCDLGSGKITIDIVDVLLIRMAGKRYIKGIGKKRSAVLCRGLGEAVCIRIKAADDELARGALGRVNRLNCICSILGICCTVFLLVAFAVEYMVLTISFLDELHLSAI